MRLCSDIAADGRFCRHFRKELQDDHGSRTAFARVVAVGKTATCREVIIMRISPNGVIS